MTYHTVDHMPDHELVAVILGRRPSDAACAALAAAMTTDGLVSADALIEVVREHGNVGRKSIAKLESALELGRRTLHAQATRTAPILSAPEEVAELMRPLLIGLNREHFYALALNTKNRLLKVIEVSVGSLNASIVHPRELMREAIAASAASIIVVHCHPSGDPTPSGADIQLTRRITKAGDVIGIEVLDHVIVGGEEHASLRDLGLM